MPGKPLTRLSPEARPLSQREQTRNRVKYLKKRPARLVELVVAHNKRLAKSRFIRLARIKKAREDRYERIRKDRMKREMALSIIRRPEILAELEVSLNEDIVDRSPSE